MSLSIPHGSRFHREDLDQDYSYDAPTRSWLLVVGGSGTPLTVQESDGAPAVADVDNLQFDQADGFVVSDLGSGDVRVDLLDVPQARIQNLVADLAAKEAAGTAAGLIAAHEAAADPHTGYQRESEKGVAGGYASLDGSALLPLAQLPSHAHAAADVTSGRFSQARMPDAAAGFLKAGGVGVDPAYAALVDGDIPATIARDTEVSSAIATHEAAADPHTGYQRESEKDAANGYAGLDANARVVSSKIQVSATDRFLGRDTAGAGAAEEITGTAATALLDTFTDVLKGLAPASGGGTTNFLRADGTWAATPGGAGGNFVEITLEITDDIVGLVYEKVITGQSWVSAASIIVASLFAEDNGGTTEEMVMASGVTIGIKDLVAGTGFTVWCYNPHGFKGTLTVHCVGN